MEYMYSALLLNSAGKDVNEENITAILKAAGINTDAGKVKAVVSALEGADFAKAIENATAAPVAVAAAPAAAAPAAAAAEPEPEEDKGVSEEEAAAGLGALFG